MNRSNDNTRLAEQPSSRVISSSNTGGPTFKTGHDQRHTNNHDNAKHNNAQSSNGTPQPTKPAKQQQQGGRYQISVSFGFVALALLISAAIPYHVGVLVRQHMIQAHHQDTATENHLSPRLEWIHCNVHDKDSFCAIQGGVVNKAEKDSDSDDASSSRDDGDEDDDEDESHRLHSLGQQLLVDLPHQENLDGDMIPSLLRLASSKGWSLRSHLCPTTEQTMCTFLFEKGQHMVVNMLSRTLDIFSPDKSAPPLLHWMDEMPLPSLSAVAGGSRWAFQPRATPSDHDIEMVDLYSLVLGSFEYTQKRLVAREVSPFQEVAIYDTMDPRHLSRSAHRASKAKDGNSYYQENAHFFQPDRQMFLDGTVQSRKHGERAYHEALVHPAMMMHPNPQHVAIIGAGEGATLREVLKHSCLKQVIMIEIDPFVMDLSRKYLGQWNDCSDLQLPEGLENPTGNCFDDPRATVLAEDAIRWFMEGYPVDNGNNNTMAINESFDVIIMDALDPDGHVEFSDVLFDNTDLVSTFYRALSPQGIFVSQIGEQTFLSDPNPTWTSERHALKFLQNLGRVGFSRLFDYEEPSTRFSGLWSFLLASKSSDTSRLYSNPAQVDLELQQRSMPTKSGASPFRYFDGATMQAYQKTSRPVAVSNCRTSPESPACQRGPGLSARPKNVPSLQAVAMINGKLIAKQDLELGSFIGLEECVYQTLDMPHDAIHTMKGLREYTGGNSSWDSWISLVDQYGMPAAVYGEQAMILDLGLDVWMQQCPLTESPLEPIETGVSNAMLERYWRIHTCAAKRSVGDQSVSAGSPIECS